MTEIALNTSPETETASVLSSTTLDNSPALYQVTREVFAERFAKYGPEIFIVAEGEITQLRFLNGLPEGVRQEYTCNTCAKFMKDTANFVFIKDDGTLISALWDHTRAPAFYADAVKALEARAENGTVINVFRPRDFDERSKAGNLTNTFKGTFGAEEKGGFRHFSLTLPEFAIQVGNQYKGTPKTRHDLLFQNISIDADLATLNTALALFNSDRLMRKDQYVPWIQWLVELRNFADSTKNQKLLNNYLAKKAIGAPVGWVEFRSSMVGSLFAMLRRVDAKELQLDTVIDEFNKNADPINYQRAKAEATQGNIIAMAKTLKAMNLESAMRRRWARFDEIKPFLRWAPKPTAEEAAAEASGLFDHMLKKHTKQAPEALDVNIPPTNIPLFRFLRDVLPTAEKLQVYVSRAMGIGGMTTAADENAGCIMRWDRPEARNPFCQFNLVTPVRPEEFGLRSHSWIQVRGVSDIPKHFHRPEDAAKDAHLLLELEGVEKFTMSASALFKETCISELHAFGPTIEEYSNTTPMGEVEASAKAVHTGVTTGTHLKVTVGKVTTTYILGDMSL